MAVKVLTGLNIRMSVCTHGKYEERMKNRKYLVLGMAALLLALCIPAQADLLGTTVTGSLKFDGNINNYFDPAHAFVPAGYLNAAGTTVTIASPAVEFGFDDGFNLDTANFTGAQLTITDVVEQSGQTDFNVTMTFTDAAFAGMNVVELGDVFPNGGFTAALAGDVLTLTWAGGAVNPGTLTATYALTAVPEPASIAFFGTILAGIGATIRARRRRSES